MSEECGNSIRATGNRVRLSQCMIVKNEEKNIRSALEWAKPVVYEQIVVDTGSTDRTVEIAEQMGAKVFHFEWIDDFSAARNYSIEQATGDWILITDADEYILAEDAGRLIEHIERVDSDPKTREDCLSFGCVGISIDENGNPMSRSNNMRMFRNIPSIRFFGRVHEHLAIDDTKIQWMNDVQLFHTGYSQSAIKEANKAERNISLLRTELLTDPDNMSMKAYLADSLKLTGDEDDSAEADRLFLEVINSDAIIIRKLRVKAYVNLMNKRVNDRDKREECERLCQRALAEFPGCIDFEYFLASLLNYKGEFQAAWDLLRVGEEKLATGADTGVSLYVPSDPTMLYGQLLLAAQGLGDIDSVMEYAALILRHDKARHDILAPYISMLINQNTSEDEVLGKLGEFYDIGNPNDLMLIARAAKDCGAMDFARLIMIIAKELIENQ